MTGFPAPDRLSPLCSMTAFARADRALPEGAAAWEVRSVNGKGLDIRLRMPPGLDAHEAACRALIAGGLTRGSVHATLTLQRTAASPRVRIDAALLRSLVEAAAAAAPPALGLAPPTMDGLLAIRGVVDVAEPADRAEDQAALGIAVVALLREALADLGAARVREGAALGQVLGGHVRAIEGLCAAAEAAPGRAPAVVLARLTRSVEMLVGTASGLDPARLHQEAMLLAARADIREELDRLHIHARSGRDMLAAGGPVGRRLDFLAQEFAREASTLCAKAVDADLTAIGLDLRNRIEQFREQVQNLE